jgi:hypothetical protein
MLDLARAFLRARYVTWPGLLSSADLRFFYGYACARASTMYLDDPAVPGTPSIGGDAVMDQLLVDLLPRVEDATELELYPTYSYFRVYKHGDVLRKHRDRPACEVSLSVCLGCEPNAPWPIWIEGPGGSAAVGLGPGDAVLYRGIECAHWREACPGTRVAQVFLHYVDKHGPNSDWKYDKGPPLPRVSR